MTFSVRLTKLAKQDIRDISRYISANDSPQHSQCVVREIKERIRTLDQFPQRGGRPIELLKMDIHEFHEKLVGPYRIFYRIDENVVHVVAVADGRRDMLAFLIERLG